MRSTLTLTLVLAIGGLLAQTCHLGAYPTPATYPSSWQLTFEHSTAKRILVTPPGGNGPQAYWYVTYKVTNPMRNVRDFIPSFTMVDKNGKATKSEVGVSPLVFDAIKQSEHDQFLLPSDKVTGPLLVGDDQAKDGVAIWPEPSPRMGKFSIFIQGLSGEAQIFLPSGSGFTPVENIDALKPDEQAKIIILHKVLEMDFQVAGDPIAGRADQTDESWVMR